MENVPKVSYLDLTAFPFVFSIFTSRDRRCCSGQCDIAVIAARRSPPLCCILRRGQKRYKRNATAGKRRVPVSTFKSWSSTMRWAMALQDQAPRAQIADPLPVRAFNHLRRRSNSSGRYSTPNTPARCTQYCRTTHMHGRGPSVYPAAGSKATRPSNLMSRQDGSVRSL